MQTLFDPADRTQILQRLSHLEIESARQWGKMTPAQMMAHCSLALESAVGVRPARQKLIGKLLSPFVRKSMLGTSPFGRNSPTDPDLKVAEPRDYTVERNRLRQLIERFGHAGATAAGQYEHAFLGKVSGDEWGGLMWKHLDHHLRQFGV